MNLTASPVLLAIVSAASLLTSAPAAFAADPQGSWTKSAVTTTGSWSIEGRKLILHNLKTDKAPDLKLILSPQAVGDLKSQNAMQGAVVISKIKKTKGSFTFEIPADIDLSRYQSIGIHCEKYSKLFGKSAL